MATTERAALVEAAAIDALARAEQLEEFVTQEGAALRAADAFLADSDEELLRHLAPLWIEKGLGDDSVWLNPSVLEAAAEVRKEFTARAFAESTVMVEDWLDNLRPGSKSEAVRELNEYPYRAAACDFDTAAKDGRGWKSKAAFDCSRLAASEFVGGLAEKHWLAAVVRLAATDATLKLGLDFWASNIIAVNYRPANPAGVYAWQAYPREPGNPRTNGVL
jgi:hypothetical protein